jgi:hypothetical protein
MNSSSSSSSSTKRKFELITLDDNSKPPQTETETDSEKKTRLRPLAARLELNVNMLIDELNPVVEPVQLLNNIIANCGNEPDPQNDDDDEEEEETVLPLNPLLLPQHQIVSLIFYFDEDEIEPEMIRLSRDTLRSLLTKAAFTLTSIVIEMSPGGLPAFVALLQGIEQRISNPFTKLAVVELVDNLSLLSLSDPALQYLCLLPELQTLRLMELGDLDFICACQLGSSCRCGILAALDRSRSCLSALELLNFDG